MIQLSFSDDTKLVKESDAFITFVNKNYKMRQGNDIGVTNFAIPLVVFFKEHK